MSLTNLVLLYGIIIPSMIEMARNNSMNKEFEPAGSRIHIFFVRHGQPEVYGEDNSQLSYDGVIQVIKSSEYFSHRLRFDPGEKKMALYMSSDRKRAQQTTRIMAEVARDYVEEHNLRNVVITQTATPHAFISTENTLTKVMEECEKMGYPKEKAASLWLNMSREMAESLGIRSSETVANEARQLIAELMFDTREKGEKNTHLYYFLGTHETTLMAMLYHMAPRREFKIGYADFIEVETTKSSGPRLTYRNANKLIENGGLIVDYWENQDDLNNSVHAK